MNKIITHKADPITEDKSVPSAFIEISKPLPKIRSMLEAEELHRTDALRIFYAMKCSLPQGTRYEIIKLFLADSSNLYRGL